jgi:hypothetical protein
MTKRLIALLLLTLTVACASVPKRRSLSYDECMARGGWYYIESRDGVYRCVGPWR